MKRWKSWESVNEWMLEVSTFGGAASEAKWLDCKQTAFNKSDKFFDVLQLKDLLKFIIYNAFVNNQGSFLNQSEGIPRGTKAAPELATLYLYSYEASYIDELCKLTFLKLEAFIFRSVLSTTFCLLTMTTLMRLLPALKKVVSTLKLFLVDKQAFLMIMCNSVA